MDYIDELLSSSYVNRVKHEDGNTYGIKVLSKGETMFFQKNNLGLICSIDILAMGIEKRSIIEWSNGDKISEHEREALLPKIIWMFEKFYGRGKPATAR